MAVTTAIGFVLAFVFGYMMFMIGGRIVYDSRYENSMWDSMPTNIIAFGDQQYGIWLLFTILIAAVIVMASWRQSTNARALEG